MIMCEKNNTNVNPKKKSEKGEIISILGYFVYSERSHSLTSAPFSLSEGFNATFSTLPGTAQLVPPSWVGKLPSYPTAGSDNVFFLVPRRRGIWLLFRDGSRHCRNIST